jgi:hypothetical protein
MRFLVNKRNQVIKKGENKQIQIGRVKTEEKIRIKRTIERRQENPTHITT